MENKELIKLLREAADYIRSEFETHRWKGSSKTCFDNLRTAADELEKVTRVSVKGNTNLDIANFKSELPPQSKNRQEKIENAYKAQIDTIGDGTVTGDAFLKVIEVVNKNGALLQKFIDSHNQRLEGREDDLAV